VAFHRARANGQLRQVRSSRRWLAFNFFFASNYRLGITHHTRELNTGRFYGFDIKANVGQGKHRPKHEDVEPETYTNCKRVSQKFQHSQFPPVLAAMEISRIPPARTSSIT